LWPELDELALVRQQAALFLEGRIDARKDAIQLDMPSSSCSIEYGR
jgi:hypothetical protein